MKVDRRGGVNGLIVAAMGYLISGLASISGESTQRSRSQMGMAFWPSKRPFAIPASTHEDFQSYYRLGKMCNLRIEPGFSARFSQAIFGLQSALNL